MSKKLTRVMDDKILGGVCSGLAEYFNKGLLGVRWTFVIVAFLFAGIPIVILYLIMWAVIPAEISKVKMVKMAEGKFCGHNPICRHLLNRGSWMECKKYNMILMMDLDKHLQIKCDDCLSGK